MGKEKLLQQFLADMYQIFSITKLEIKKDWIFVTYINPDLGMLYPQTRGIELKEFTDWEEHMHDFEPINFSKTEELT